MFVKENPDREKKNVQRASESAQEFYLKPWEYEIFKTTSKWLL